MPGLAFPHAKQVQPNNIWQGRHRCILPIGVIFCFCFLKVSYGHANTHFQGNLYDIWSEQSQNQHNSTIHRTLLLAWQHRCNVTVYLQHLCCLVLIDCAHDEVSINTRVLRADHYNKGTWVHHILSNSYCPPPSDIQSYFENLRMQK